MKYFISLMLVLSLSACGTLGGGKSKTTKNNIEVDGDIISVVMDSADFSDMKKTLAAEESRTKCFEANAVNEGSDIVAVASIVARAAGKGIDCGTNHNDTVIAGINSKVEKHRIWGGVASGVLGNIPLAAGAYVLGKALDKDSTEINVDNGSTVTGAIGEGNTYRVEQVSGILTEPAPVNPITLDGSEPGEGEESIPPVDFATCIAAGGDPVNTDGNVMVSAADGIYSRCSDGAGGTL